MTLENFIQKLKNTPKNIAFSDTMAVIDAHYIFTPTAFKNGDLQNKLGENNGSCKLFAFAKMQKFTTDETLACFGEFYYEDVLKNPNGTGHQNIRNFIKTGFQGLVFDQNPLSERS